MNLEETLGNTEDWPAYWLSNTKGDSTIAVKLCPVCKSVTSDADTHKAWHVGLGK